MDRSSTQHYTEELYFLIAKFLEAGPCKNTLKALKEEISEHKIIPKRLDWEGEEHEQSFDELAIRYPHIAHQHLLEICKRIGPILDKEIAPCAPGVKTLLGAGRQSLLRNRDVIKKHLRLTEYIVRRHGNSIYSPITCHNHNIVKVLYGQEVSGPASRRHIITPRFYSRVHLLNRTLGHLTAVYCLLFDQTGKFIFTGADDLLVKVWSAVDGRLLCTLRGASAEITDIAINIENTLIAAGSLDKIIRVWCLQTAYPVANLSGHTGMITGVNFCPNPFNNNYYLVSTSTDGSVAFWSYTLNSDEPVVFQSKPVLYHEKIRPGQAQMICSSYSRGGVFLAAGSADHHVRVYSMASLPPHRILEMEKHTDRVDSILWANKSLKFISGSKDGTAVIWQYKAQRWQTSQLDMSVSLPTSKRKPDETKLKLKVTMVCWSGDDTFAITAVNNNVIKIWTSDGKLIRELTAHEDVVYCLENHPLDHRILLSAGHDGTLYLWDIITGEQLFTHQNHIDGQGNGAIFDAKWSPDGTMMAATDSHGHLLIFGLAAYCDKIKHLPKELFFHSDYRPLTRGVGHEVLDEQTLLPPHLMPPPFLVDIDGNPHPPFLQRLVPGREHCSFEQLVPNIFYTATGQPEVIQFVGESRPTDQGLNDMNLHYSEGLRQGSRIVRRDDSGSSNANNFSWKKRILITPVTKGALEKVRSCLKFLGKLELEEFETESKRECPMPEIPTSIPKKPKKKQNHSYRTRAAKDEPAGNAENDEDDENNNSDDNSSSISGISNNLSSSSESSSSEYSDWVADHSVNLEPPQRSRRRQRKRKPPPAAAAATPSPPPTPAISDLPKTSLPSTSKKPTIPETITEIPDVYRPSEWLSEVIPKKFPYYPQMGDEVMFFAQGYELYLKAVTIRNVYQLAKSQLKPWGNDSLQEPELVKVIGIKYELRPPRLCCLRLAVMKESGRLTGERFTIKYHDIPDVIDFFVLKQTYDTAMTRNWKIGDRFRSMIDDGWWWGSIEGKRPDANSPFLCHRIRWDNGETEDMSPWDMEPIDPSREPDKGGSVPVLPEEIAEILYHPRIDEWPGGDRDTSCRRTMAALEEIMGLSIAEPFLAPVDINVYKSYAFIVEYPIDLSTIKARFENRFYRRLTAAQFDIRYLATNAEKFNEVHSIIVKHARVVTDLCLRICKEEEVIDVSALYRQILDSYESSNSDEEGGGPSTSKRERAAANRSLRALRRANYQQPDWRRDCRQLLEVLWSCQDSEPFRGPVDSLEHPDYDKIIDTPMDLGIIREELKGGNYSSPLEFCKDIRMIFSNSRSYNTNKRSKIYVMTVRLAAMAEEHMKRIIKDWKASFRKENKNMNVRKRSTRNTRSLDSNDNSGNNDENSSSISEQPSTSTRTGRKRSTRNIRSLDSNDNSGSIDENSSSMTELPSTSGNQGRKRPTRNSRPQDNNDNSRSNDGNSSSLTIAEQRTSITRQGRIIVRLPNSYDDPDSGSFDDEYSSLANERPSTSGRLGRSDSRSSDNNDNSVDEDSSSTSDESSNSRRPASRSQRNRRLPPSQNDPSRNSDENSDLFNGSRTRGSTRTRKKPNSYLEAAQDDSSSSSDELLDNSQHQGNYRTRSNNVRNHQDDNSNRQALRPLRLRINRFNQLNSANTSDEPSSSSGQRSLRATRAAISYAENGDNSLSSEAENGNAGGPARSRVKPKLNYNEESESEVDDDYRKTQNTNRGNILDKIEDDDDKESGSKNSSNDSNLDTDQEESGNEVTVNGVGKHRPNSSTFNGKSGLKERTSTEDNDSLDIDDDVDFGHDKNDKDYNIGDDFSEVDSPLPRSSRKRKKSSGTDSSGYYHPRKVTPVRKSSRAKRPLKKQNYTYDSDSEMEKLDDRPTRATSRRNYGESVESSDDSAEDKPKISVSSRGRIRKISSKARPFFMD